MSGENGNASHGAGTTAARGSSSPSSAAAAKWINAGPDEGALFALLERVAERVPREHVDTLWIFPTRVTGGVESTVIVVAGFDADADRRSVATAHFKVTRDKRGRATVTLQMQEHGTAPVGATQRVVDGVVRRLGDEVGSQSPRREEIAGSTAAWWELYRELGGVVPDAEREEAAMPASSSSEQGGVAADEPEASVEDDGEETPPHGDPLLDAADKDEETSHGDLLLDAADEPAPQEQRTDEDPS